MPGIPVARVVAVIAETASGRRRVGSGYLLDRTRVLTAWHCTIDMETGLTAASLKVARASDCAVAPVMVGSAAPGLDVALLTVIAEPPWATELPDGPVALGRVDREHAGQLDGCEAVGFPRWQVTTAGSSTYRDVAEVHGLIRMLEGRENQRLVLRDPVLGGVTSDAGSAWAGFSGAAVFFGEVLLGVVIEHHARQGATALQIRPVEAVAQASDAAARRLAEALGIGGGRGLQLVAASPGHWRAEDAGDAALAQWGWSLERDREGVRHWRPRARGVSFDSERGWRFRGRTAALTRIVAWLEQPQPERRVLVVIGSPGAGKSAVLGRIVTTADAAVRASLPPEDQNVRAPKGSVGCAVHAKGKTALEVAIEIARAASAKPPEQVEDFASVLSATLSERNRRFNVIIDALDEVASPAEARTIITKVVAPMTETCADVGAQVIVGTRFADEEGSLLEAFGGAERLVDLDDPEFFAEADLAAYALATLQLAGNERPGNPYADAATAGPMATRIAELSERNFLVAGLTARTHGLYDETAVDPSVLSFTAKVDDAMREYLRRIPPVTADVTPETLLTALAFAEAPGLPARLWRTALRALEVGDVPERVLNRFARSSAASFLVETSGGDGRGAAFRLFHQALNDALLHARSKIAERNDDERALAQAFLAVGREEDWKRAPAYLLRSLPAHAAFGGIDDLLTDDEYLLHADLRRVLQAARHEGSPAVRTRARLLGLTPEAVTAGPAERAAMFGVTEALNGLNTAYQQDPRPVPYRAQWAAAQPSGEHLTLRGHQLRVTAVCAVPAGGRTLLATSSDDGKVRLWDPADGALVRVLDGHQGRVTSMCAVPAGGRTFLATSSDDGKVRLWDPADEILVRVLDGHQGRVTSMCAVPAGSRTLLATGGVAGIGGIVCLWDPADETQVRAQDGNQFGVNAVCAVPTGSRTVLATGGIDGKAYLWDPADGTQIRVLDGHHDAVMSVCAVPAGSRTLLATGSDARPVRLWDPVDGTLVRVLGDPQSRVTAMCAVPAGSRIFLATGGRDGKVRLWDPVDGTLVRVLDGHQGRVTSMCAVPAGSRTFLATSSDDRTVRLWDPRISPSDKGTHVHQGRVTAMCAVPVGSLTLLATASDDRTVRLRHPADGTQVRALDGPQGRVTSMCAVPADGRTFLATGSDDGTVCLWDPADGAQACALTLVPVDGPRGLHEGGISAVCAVLVGGRALLAFGSDDGLVCLLDPAGEIQVRALNYQVLSVDRLDRGLTYIRVQDGRRGGVTAMCAVPVGSRTFLATGGRDGKVRLWDPADGTLVRVLDGHHGRVTSMCAVPTDSRTFLATSSDDKTVRLWDPADGTLVRVLDGHQGRVTSMCAVPADSRTFLATSSDDQTVRLWGLAQGRCVLTVPVHSAAWAVASAVGSLAVGLSAGVLVIRLEPDFLEQPSSS